MSTDQVGEQDKVLLNSNDSVPSSVLPEIKPGDAPIEPLAPAPPQSANDIHKAGTDAIPAVDIEEVGDAVKPTNGPSSVEKEGQNGDSGAPKEKQEDAKPDEPQDEKSEEADKIHGQEAAQVGDKRKADEKDVPEKPAGTEEVKKQKTSNGTAATNGSAANGSKEEAASKATEKKAAGPKKEKKVLRTGTAERKTRSQGTAPEAGL